MLVNVWFRRKTTLEGSRDFHTPSSAKISTYLKQVASITYIALRQVQYYLYYLENTIASDPPFP